MSKAFDCVGNGILVENLFGYGLRDNALNLVKSYLENSFQYVAVDARISNSLSVAYCGFPPCPHIFATLASDIPVMFADATTLIASAKSEPELGANSDCLVDRAKS